MNAGSDAAYIAFDGERRIASGDLGDVARATKQLLNRRKDASVLIFDGQTSGPVDLDFRGSVDDVLARLPKQAPPTAEDDTAVATTLGLAVAAERRCLGRAPQTGRRSAANQRGQRSDPPCPGSRLPLHVG